jgi:hypothetical protein
MLMISYEQRPNIDQILKMHPFCEWEINPERALVSKQTLKEMN